MIRVRQVKINILNDNHDNLLKMIAKKINIKVDDIKKYIVNKKSIDARSKPDLFYIYEVDIEVLNENSVLNKNKNNNDVILTPDERYIMPLRGNIKIDKRPVIIGSKDSFNEAKKMIKR